LKLLIIGSHGFLGSNISSHFEFLGHDVFFCDFLDIRNEKNYFRINPFKSDYLEIFENHQFDLVINCAGSANVGASMEDPFFDFDLNVNVVSKILGAIYKTNKETKLINISSAAVYGNPIDLPIRTEQAEHAIPISPYGVHKRMSEVLLKYYYDAFNIPTCSLRVFSAYGNGQKKLLMWDLFQKFQNDESDMIELFGTGNETRDFIHLDDILQQIELVIKHASFNGESLNIANGRAVKISEIAAIFQNHLNSNKSIKFNNIVREGDPLHWCADIETLKSWGYTQTLRLNEGIKQYIDWNCEEKN
jgi:dTDP-glucose 4,6-dehydratase/UDP-glucose 4-epimerase